MKSPFPGMDPYIEASGLWADFHDDLIAEIKRSLAATLPERYFVQTGERSYVVYLGPEGKKIRPFNPDLAVERERQPENEPVGGAVAVAEPEAEADAIDMRAFIDEHFRENFIEIIEAKPEMRLVTSIEVLSPANKRPGTDGWDLFLRKRNSLLLGNANVVEIDLLRGGERMPMMASWPNSPYYLLVGWKHHVPYCKVSPVHYRRPLPAIPVPLAPPDPDLNVSLQPLIDAVYERSRYGRRLDYTKPLTPPLPAADAAWLAQQVQARAT